MNITDLPREMLEQIYTQLPYRSMSSLRLTGRAMNIGRDVVLNARMEATRYLDFFSITDETIEFIDGLGKVYSYHISTEKLTGFNIPFIATKLWCNVFTDYNLVSWKEEIKRYVQDMECLIHEIDDSYQIKNTYPFKVKTSFYEFKSDQFWYVHCDAPHQVIHDNKVLFSLNKGDSIDYLVHDDSRNSMILVFNQRIFMIIDFDTYRDILKFGDDHPLKNISAGTMDDYNYLMGELPDPCIMLDIFEDSYDKENYFKLLTTQSLYHVTIYGNTIHIHPVLSDMKIMNFSSERQGKNIITTTINGQVYLYDYSEHDSRRIRIPFTKPILATKMYDRHIVGLDEHGNLHHIELAEEENYILDAIPTELSIHT